MSAADCLITSCTDKVFCHLLFESVRLEDKQRPAAAATFFGMQSLAKANRARLAVLLGEMQSSKSSEERYEAALRGESLGTHSRGTTVGAQSISRATTNQQKQQ